MENEIYLTKEGYKALQEKLDYLKSTKREEVSKKIGIAREFGDLSENAEYDAARNEQAQIEAKIRELEVMIHQPLGGVEGQATEIKIAAEHILKIKDKLNKILAINTNQDIKKIENDTERDNFMSADEALKYGLIDKILEKK